MKNPLTILCIFALTTTGIRANTEEISGLIFTRVGRVQLTYNSWKICYYFDLNEYYMEKNTLKVIISKMKTICNQLTEHENCNILTKQLETEYNKMLYEKTNIRRSRRSAPLPSVGKILNVVFGVMDEEEAKLYEEKINEMVRETNRHNDILNEQTTIIMKSISSSNETLHKFQGKLMEIAKELKEQTSIQNRVIDEVKLREKINFLTEVATLIIIDHRDLTNRINSLLSDTTTGDISDMIDVNAIESDLALVKTKIERGEDFPIELNTKNIHELFTFSQVKAKITNSSIFIELSVPIVDAKTFVSYEVTPIPIRIQNNIHIMKIKSKHLLANFETGEIVEMNDSDHCFGKNGRVCEIRSPIITDGYVSCESRLLMKANIDVDSKICETKRLQQATYVVPISKTNDVYILPAAKSAIKIICRGKEVEVLTLSEPKVIEITPRCTMIIGSYKLRGHETNYFNSTEIKPVVQLNKLNFDETDVEKTREPKTILINDMKIFEDMRPANILEKVNKQKIEEIKLKSESHTYGILGILGVTLLVIIFVGYVFIKKILPIATAIARMANPVPIPI